MGRPLSITLDQEQALLKDATCPEMSLDKVAAKYHLSIRTVYNVIDRNRKYMPEFVIREVFAKEMLHRQRKFVRKSWEVAEKAMERIQERLKSTESAKDIPTKELAGTLRILLDQITVLARFNTRPPGGERPGCPPEETPPVAGWEICSEKNGQKRTVRVMKLEQNQHQEG